MEVTVKVTEVTRLTRGRYPSSRQVLRLTHTLSKASGSVKLTRYDWGAIFVLQLALWKVKFAGGVPEGA